MIIARPFALLAVVLAAGAVAVIVFCGAVRGSGPASIQFVPPEAAASAAAPADGQMKVHVTGAVQRPGVYSVHPGDRVADAIEAAGGPAEDADTLRINLATRLRDEGQVIVPRRGEPLPISAGGAPSTTGGGGRIDINTAIAATLETLPGIGPTRAKAIVDSRTRDGPFTDTTDLVKRKVVPQSVYDGFKDQIDVRP